MIFPDSQQKLIFPLVRGLSASPQRRWNMVSLEPLSLWNYQDPLFQHGCLQAGSNTWQKNWWDAWFLPSQKFFNLFDTPYWEKLRWKRFWSRTRAGISKYVENVICLFSNMSLSFRYLLCDSLLPWQPLSLCGLYFRTDKERQDPPIPLAGSTWWGEAICDWGCVASRPMLTHLPLVVRASLI